MTAKDIRDPTDDRQWYFAYGANMLDSVFVARRKIHPLRHEVASIPTHCLCFNVPGVPYSEPAMGGIRLSSPYETPVYGVAYLLTAEDMRRVVLTEGGGVAYKIELLAATVQRDGAVVHVRTLVARHSGFGGERRPSQRYMGLLIRGAAEKSLPEAYQALLLRQPTFQPLATRRFRLGKYLFNGFWQPVSTMIQKGIRIFQDDAGHVPAWFLCGFDCLLWSMWHHHDWVHCVLWGRGDGL